MTAETVEVSDSLNGILGTDEATRIAKAEAIVKRNIYWSMGAGIFPVPLLDLITISAVQVKMIRELSKLYGVTFSESLVANSIGSLVGGVGSVELGKGVMASLTKLIPGYGSAMGVVAVPVSAGAITYAIGNVFIMHLESGGTLLDFDPKKVKSFYADLLEKGKEIVGDLKGKSQEEAETEAPKAKTAKAKA